MYVKIGLNPVKVKDMDLDIYNNETEKEYKIFIRDGVAYIYEYICEAHYELAWSEARGEYEEYSEIEKYIPFKIFYKTSSFFAYMEALTEYGGWEIDRCELIRYG